MRILVILALVLIAILEIGPIPITPILLIYIVLWRPAWFYACVLKIYGRTRDELP
ncbi:MAG: hypothetical protein Q8Q50_05355 [Methylobacter sp.]|jgi:hypothetical protein|nr:hypothetical protein [Methylobacter sp.]